MILETAFLYDLGSFLKYGIFVFIFGHGITYFVLYYNLFYTYERLEQRHPEKFRELGEPVYKDPPKLSPRFRQFLWSQEPQQLNDARLERMLARVGRLYPLYRVTGWTTTVAMFLVIFLVFGGYITR